MSRNAILKKMPGNYGTTEERAILYRLMGERNAIVSGFALLYFLVTQKSVLAKDRVRFIDIMNSRLSLGRIRKSIKLSKTVHLTTNTFDRLRIEYEQNEKWLKNIFGLFKNESRELPGNKHYSFKEYFVDSIEYQLSLISNHLQPLRSSLTEYVHTRNIEIMFKLQRRIFWLTIAVVIISILGLLSNWNSLKAIFNANRSNVSIQADDLD